MSEVYIPESEVLAECLTVPEFRAFYEAERDKITWLLLWTTVAPAYNAVPHYAHYRAGARSAECAIIRLDRIPATAGDCAVVAHEMTHGVLFGEGFPMVNGAEQLAVTLTILLNDPLINRRIARFGLVIPGDEAFDLKMLNLPDKLDDYWLARLNMVFMVAYWALEYEIATGSAEPGLVEQRFAAKHPKLGNDVRKLLKMIRRIGYDTPEKCHKILALIISDNDLRRAGLSLSERSATGAAIKLLADPWEYRRLFLFGSQGGVTTNDATVAAPLWNTVNLASTTGATFTQHFNLRTSDYSFTIVSNGISSPSYIPGVGFKVVSAGASAGMDDLTIRLDFPSAIIAPTMRIVGSRSNATLSGQHLNGLNNSGSTIESYAEPTGAGAIDFSHAFASTLYGVLGQMAASNIVSSTGIITDFYVSGNGANPFTGATGGGLEEFVADAIGSINKRAAFWYFAQRGGTALYIDRTVNYFGNILPTTPVASYSGSMAYGLALSSFNPGAGSVGYGYCTGGTPGSDAYIYATSDYFASVSSTGKALNVRGGPISIPYQVSGTVNAGTAPKFIAVKGLSGGTLQCYGLSGSVSDICTGSQYPYSQQSLVSFTNDGSRAMIITNTANLYTTTDGGGSWSLAGSAPMHGSFAAGINGSPVNPNVVLAFGDGLNALSTNGGGSWIDLWPGSAGYDAFATANYATAAPIITEMLDLSLAYQSAVVQP